MINPPFTISSEIVVVALPTLFVPVIVYIPEPVIEPVIVPLITPVFALMLRPAGRLGLIV
jgi:hypothetical protein